MRRDYIKGAFDSEDIALEDVGSGTLALKLDGMISFAFSDLQIFSDSNYTAPLNPGEFEAVTEDEDLTTEESDVAGGGSGKTIYVSFRILSPTYQSGFIYVRVNNFGAFTNGKLVGQDLDLKDASFSHTIDTGVFLKKFKVSGLSADITATLTDDNGDSRNVVEIDNSDSTYKVDVTDGIDTMHVEPGQTVKFWFNSGSLQRNPGLGLIFDDYSNNSGFNLNTLNQFKVNRQYFMIFDESGSPNLVHSSNGYIFNQGTTCFGTDSGSSVIRFRYNVATTFLDNQTTSYHVKKIWRMYI